MQSFCIARSAALAIGVFVFVSSSFVPTEASAKGELLIGYVNLQRAILEVEEGKRAKNTLKKAFDKKKIRIEADQKALLAIRDQIRKDAAVKTDKSVRQRAMEYEKKRYELQEQLLKEQKELQALEQGELAQITKKMRKVIKKIGVQGKYTLILELQDARLLYAKQHLDLTNEVIRRYDKKHP